MKKKFCCFRWLLVLYLVQLLCDDDDDDDDEDDDEDDDKDEDEDDDDGTERIRKRRKKLMKGSHNIGQPAAFVINMSSLLKAYFARKTIKISRKVKKWK